MVNKNTKAMWTFAIMYLMIGTLLALSYAAQMVSANPTLYSSVQDYAMKNLLPFIINVVGWPVTLYSQVTTAGKV